jgi:hypothetical protein
MKVQVLGRAIKDLPREQIIVATKVGRYGADTFDFSAERVTRSVHESLERLQACAHFSRSVVSAFASPAGNGIGMKTQRRWTRTRR